MMYKELYQSLILHKKLSLPGVGTFLLERRPATSDFYNRKIDSPSYSIAFRTDTMSPSRKFFTWLANALNISDREAIIHFNDFVFELKNKINAGDIINWNGVGSLKKGLAGEIKFIPVDVRALFFEHSVIAEKMIRDKAEHTIRVGEDERTSTQMTELLSQPTEKRSYWWDFALVITLLAAMFIGWYYSEHGLNVSATANQKKLAPANPAITYRSIQ